MVIWKMVVLLFGHEKVKVAVIMRWVMVIRCDLIVPGVVNQTFSNRTQSFSWVGQSNSPLLN